MSYIPYRVKNLYHKENKLYIIISFFETQDNLNEFIQKEMVFDIQDIVYVCLGYIKNVEEFKENSPKISKIFKKMVSLGVYDEAKQKEFSIKEEIIFDIIVFKNELIYFRVDLTTFNYKDFLGKDSTFSSFINMRKFVQYFASILPTEKIDDIVFNFINKNSLAKIQYFTNIYEFQDYVMTMIKNKGYGQNINS